MVRFYYGVNGQFRDVSFSCAAFFLTDMSFEIPASDELRAAKLTDPCPGQEKILVAVMHDGKQAILPAGVHAKITFQNEIQSNITNALTERVRTQDHLTPEDNLKFLHGQYRFSCGSMENEMAEQLMAVRYLPRDARVLEIGANIGRNSLVISSILDDPSNLVSLECNPNYIPLLTHHRDVNRAGFHIVDAALSYRRLAMKGWDTVVIDEKIPEGHFEIRTVTFEHLQETYGSFDTLVADCEGALRYILEDCPQLLDGVKLVIMENDYQRAEDYELVRNMLVSRGMTRVFVQGWGFGPCINNFHEVWKL